MTRQIYQGSWKDGSGSVISGGSVTVYLANTTTLATIYTSITGGGADTDSVIVSDAEGKFVFYIDEADYEGDQLFKLTLSKTGYQSKNYDYINILQQRFDSGLESIAGLTTAADKMIYTSGSDTYAVTNLTAAGRTFLTATSTAEQKAAIELGVKYLSEYSSIHTAITAIGATETTLVVDKDATLTKADTVPNTLTLKFLQGNTIGGAWAFTINGVIESGAYQIFSSTLTDNVATGNLVPYVHLEWWGGAGNDSTDNTIPFQYAMATNSQVTIQLLDGIYLIGKNDDTFGAVYTGVRTVVIRGLGEQRTRIENTHATGAGIRFSGTDGKLEDLTYDNGSSTGYGVAFFAQNTGISRVQMQNQGVSGQYMLLVDGATGWKLDDVKINLGINNALHVGETLPTGHISVNNLAIDLCTGVQIKMSSVAGSMFSGVILDEGGNAGSIIMTSCSQVTWQALTTEYQASCVLAIGQYISMDSCESIFFRNTRINHDTGTASKKIFATLSSVGVNSNIVIDGLDFKTDKTGMTILSTDGADKGVYLKSVKNYSTSAIVGVTNSGIVNSLTIDGWFDAVTTATHTLNAINLYCNGVDGDMSVTKRDAQTLVNCQGLVTGTAERSIVKIPIYVETITSAGNLLEYGESIVDSTAGIMTIVLRDGEVTGGVKNIRMGVDGGDVTITIGGHDTTTSYTMNDVGDNISLMWTGVNWTTLSIKGM